MAEYKIELEKLKKAGIRPEIGNNLLITLTGGEKITAKVTKVEKNAVIATTK